MSTLVSRCLQGLPWNVHSELMLALLAYACGLLSALFTALDPFFIEINYVGTWSAARRAVFQSAADR